MNGIFEGLVHRVRGGFALLPVLLLVLASVGDAEAQASRTRSGGGSDTKGGSVSRPSGPSGSSGSVAPARPSTQRSGGTVHRTRPDVRPTDRVVVDNDRRPPGDDGRRYYSPYYPWGSPWWNPYYGFSWWGAHGWYGGYYPGYGHPGYGYPGPVRTYARRVSDDMGAMDMDLSPGNTQIWIDGEYVGIADRYDGWPQYLWLREGSYRFVFYREGYRSVVREYTIRPGLVIDVEDSLERGESTPPEELFPPMPTPNRDARLRRSEEQREAAGSRETWRETWSEPRETRRERAAADFGSLRLRVEPREAAVYLDGRLVGTGEELGRLRRGLAVEAGLHRIQVVHPDFPAGYETELEVEPGQELDVEVSLGD